MNKLDSVLLAREEREVLRKKLSESGNLLISMNLNIAGLPKTNSLIAIFFMLVKKQLNIWLSANRIYLDSSSETIVHHAAGDLYLVPVINKNLTGKELKNITEQFEEQHSLGRFIDVDIADFDGKPISSGKAKKCFYCKQYPAIECRRLKRHTIAETQNFQHKEIELYLHQYKLKFLSRNCAILAQRAIIYEISLTPKPGLVNALNSGVHSDMNYRMFIDSTAVISSWFQELFENGYHCLSIDLENSLPIIRQTGLQMETEMFALSKGINTQKGLIFLMGMALYSCGYIFKENGEFNDEQFKETVKQICQQLVQNELPNVQSEIKSHGEHCFSQFNVGGIRSEAENGFPTVFNHGLPILESENQLNDKTLIMTLLSIMAELDDTNILFRSDLETLKILKQKCKLVFHNFSDSGYADIIEYCNAKKISPGGAADLLSITIFIYLIKTEFKNYDF